MSFGPECGRIMNVRKSQGDRACPLASSHTEDNNFRLALFFLRKFMNDCNSISCHLLISRKQTSICLETSAEHCLGRF